MKVLAVATAAVLAIGLWRGESGIRHYWDLVKSREVLQKTVDDLGRENAALTDEIQRLKSSPGYARKVLRDKYHETEDGEAIMFFAD